MALSWLAVRPQRRAALRLMTAGPVSTAVGAVRENNFAAVGNSLGIDGAMPECSRRPVLANLEPSPAQ